MGVGQESALSVWKLSVLSLSKWWWFGSCSIIYTACRGQKGVESVLFSPSNTFVRVCVFVCGLCLCVMVFLHDCKYFFSVKIRRGTSVIECMIRNLLSTYTCRGYGHVKGMKVHRMTTWKRTESCCNLLLTQIIYHKDTDESILPESWHTFWVILCSYFRHLIDPWNIHFIINCAVVIMKMAEI